MFSAASSQLSPVLVVPEEASTCVPAMAHVLLLDNGVEKLLEAIEVLHDHFLGSLPAFRRVQCMSTNFVSD